MPGDNMIYTTGTIAISGNTLTGTGTNFTAAGSLIRNGCTIIALTSPAQIFQITAIGDATTLTVTPASNPAVVAGTKYAILLSDSLSVDGLAQDIAETFTMYQRYMSGFADVMNGTTDVTITINGTAVTVPGQKSLAKKGANNDITSLSALTTALTVAQGGTGANDAAGARTEFGWVNDALPISLGGTGAKNAQDVRTNLGLGSSATRDAYSPTGKLIAEGDFGVGSITTNAASIPTANNGFFAGFSSPAADGSSTGFFDNLTGMVQMVRGGGSDGTGRVTQLQVGLGGTIGVRSRNNNAWSGWVTQYGTSNTTRASDGTLKAASPIVQIFHDGRSLTNAESEGCTVTRLGVGEYLIKGCVGLNSDAAWGGIDGGFDIPKDRNCQPLVWLDYEVNADGSVLIKTYHRTYPDAPTFARNLIGVKGEDGTITETVLNGDPIDIPSDQFVSVRIEMPVDSIWNLSQEAARIADEATMQ